MQTVSHYRPFVHGRVHGVGVDNRTSPDHVVTVPRSKMVHGRRYSQGNGYVYAYAHGHEFVSHGTVVHDSGMDIHDVGGDAGGSYNGHDNECVAVVHHDHDHHHHPCLLLSIMAISAL